MPGNDHEFTENDCGNVVNAFTENFDFEALDSIEDRLRQAILDGQSVKELFRQQFEELAQTRTNESIIAVLTMIYDSPNPKLVVARLAYAAGLPMSKGVSISVLAKRHRVTKQAFSQAAIRLAKKLGLKPSRQMRSTKARASMARAYKDRQERVFMAAKMSCHGKGNKNAL